MTEPTIMGCGDAEEFTTHGVAAIADTIRAALDDRGECILGLSGGSTPGPIYKLLGHEKLNWSHVKIFLIDERLVPIDDPQSNQCLVRGTLLKSLRLTNRKEELPSMIFPDTSLSVDSSIARYTAGLKALWYNHLPDLVVLGIGEDGHIGSLFPPLSDAALSDEKLLLHTTTERFAIPERITLSLNAIASAKKSVFLLKGEEKKKIWEEMMASPKDEKYWPAKRVFAQTKTTVVTWW